MLDRRFDQETFAWALKQDLEDLRLAVVKAADPQKQAVYAVLYDYALAKRQDKLIAQKRFER
ncbi:hypothetical protein [Levilactobacillus zymae]|uniref:hypothetical protein n=1 Tax=Levilactobacillus zymae TaxID=267363 RepID=UPI0028B2C515|nr:hypothetical protein [Levilactobacillus zymae]MDT6980616.1 hypothetical protein [Levilactobacillus zymae]